MSQDRIFEIQELFESILQQLPTRYLLLAQGVSRKWYETISTASMLQEALFFRPSTSHLDEYKYNDLLAQVFPPWFCQSSPDSQPFRDRDFTELPWAKPGAEDWAKAVLYKHASWRRMFVCQPALNLVVREISEGRRQYCREGRLAANDWKMGMLYDLTHRWTFSHRVPSFGVEWFCYSRPSDPGIHDTEKEAIYDEYMESGFSLAVVAQHIHDDDFKPSAELRLSLTHVVQCTGERRYPEDVDGKRFLVQGANTESEQRIVFSESEHLEKSTEYSNYIMRKTHERLMRAWTRRREPSDVED